MTQSNDSGCSIKAIKCYFIGLNSVLVLFGLCAIVAGIVAIQGFTMDSWPEELNDIINNDYLSSFSLFVILTGAVCFVLGATGIVSTICMKNFYILLVYAFVLLILGLAQIAIGCFALASGDIEEAPFVGPELNDELKNVITKDYCQDCSALDVDCTLEGALINDNSKIYQEHFECQAIGQNFDDCFNGARDTDACMIIDTDGIVGQFEVSADLDFTALNQLCQNYADNCFVKVEDKLMKSMDLVGFISLGMGLCELLGFWCGLLVANHNKKTNSKVKVEY